MEKKDIRLYYYDNGSLKKWGRLRTEDLLRHYFNKVDDCVEHIYDRLLDKNGIYYKSASRKTFVIVEYLDSYKSEIVCLVNKLNCIYLH